MQWSRAGLQPVQRRASPYLFVFWWASLSTSAHLRWVREKQTWPNRKSVFILKPKPFAHLANFTFLWRNLAIGAKNRQLSAFDVCILAAFRLEWRWLLTGGFVQIMNTTLFRAYSEKISCRTFYGPHVLRRTLNTQTHLRHRSSADIFPAWQTMT